MKDKPRTNHRSAMAAGWMPILLAATTAGCSEHDSHAWDARESRADAYIATLPSPDADARTGVMIGFVKVADGMLAANDPVDRHVDDVMLAQTCVLQTYASAGPRRLDDALCQIAEGPDRAARWRRYIMLSSSRPAIMPDDEACSG